MNKILTLIIATALSLHCLPSLALSANKQTPYLIPHTSHLIPHTSRTDDPFKTAKQALKTGNNLDAAERALVDYAQNTSTPPSERTRAYNKAAEVAQKIVSKENEKVYLKQPYDTARFFNSMQRLYEYIYLCDSIESVPDEHGRIRAKYHKTNQQMLSRHRRNLLAGGNWMMMRRRYAEAYRIFDSYCKSDTLTLQRDTMRTRIAYWATTCAYADGNMRGMLRYIDEAMRYGDEQQRLYEYKSRACLSLADTTAWLTTLEEGIRLYPESSYFFVTATNYLRAQQRHSEVMQLCKFVLQSCPDTVMYRHVLSCTYYETGQLDSCIVHTDRVIQLDPNYADAYLNKGTALLRKAEHTESLATNRNERALVSDIYRQAQSPLETYRQLSPDKSSVWAPLLYKVYYNLNMGRELDEVERIMN